MSDSLGKRRDKTFQKLAIITNSIIVAAVGITGIVAGVFALTDSSDTNPSGQNSTQPNIPTTNNSATYPEASLLLLPVLLQPATLPTIHPMPTITDLLLKQTQFNNRSQHHKQQPQPLQRPPADHK